MDKPASGKSKLPGVDIRHVGNYVVLSPSIHASGKPYEWERDGAIAEIPGHLLDLLQSKRNPDKWFQQALSSADRNNAGLGLACQLRDDGVSQDVAAEWMRAYQAEVGDHGDHPYTLAEALASLDQAYNREARESASRAGGADAGRSASSSSSHSDSHSDSTSTSHSHSWTVESMRTQAMEADMLEAEAVCERNDRRCWPGTPLYNRRQAHYVVLQALWHHLFTGEVLPHRQMQTWLNIMDPGNECGDVVDGILAAWENHQTFGNGKDIKTPRKWATDCLLKSADPDHGWKRAALKHSKEEEDDAA